MRLRRPAATPPTLRDTGKGGITAAEHVRKRAMAPGAELRFPGHWNEPDVRGALHAMQGIACAYCQRQLDDERGQVDHFRPKGGGKEAGGSNYWWLAYSFDNCFLSCGTCNSSSCKMGSISFGDIGAPYRIRRTGPSPRGKSPFRSSRRRSSRRMDTCGMEGRRARRGGFCHATRLLGQGNLRAITRRYIHRYVSPQQVNHARAGSRSNRSCGAPRYEKRRSGEGTSVSVSISSARSGSVFILREADASWLPTPREEFLVWLHHLRDRLRRIAESLRRFPNDPPNMRMLDEILWAFAVAWKDPVPNTSSSGEIATWLGDHVGPLRDAIESRLQRL